MFWIIRKRSLLSSSKHTHRRPGKRPKTSWKCLTQKSLLDISFLKDKDVVDRANVSRAPSELRRT